VEKFKGVISYPVSKGDYYIRFMRHGYCNGNGKLSFTATFPSTTTTAKISYLTLELSKGSSIKLGTVVTPAGSAVTWKSSKPSVATVSGTGKVTAKAKGTTYITAQSGTSFQRIKIIVN
ncbi:MAG: Ig-like domain-containing protein, partial [Oscillospiraceae bacterium]